jgi:hypothetical protein
MVEESKFLTLGILEERGRLTPLVYIELLLLVLIIIFKNKKWIHFMLCVLHFKVVYVFYGREVMATGKEIISLFGFCRR